MSKSNFSSIAFLCALNTTHDGSSPISPDKTSGVFPLTINFSDRSTGNVSSWSWDFGDGNTSTEQSPSHTFATAGKYTVSLQVTDGTSNDSESKTDLVWATAVQDTLYEV